MVTCSQCGAQAEGPVPDGPPLGWMVERDARTGRTSVVCPECARRHARAIEGKLDQAWW